MWAALLELASCTRPPVVHGFSLSDLWAWYRYIPALAATPDLRLRPEWDQIDAHQKAVLSDELGVGFGVHVLRGALDIIEVADTRRVVEIALPGQYALTGPRKRRGPFKAPDYFFITARGERGVVECKGSQTAVRALRGAMVQGVAQKQSIRPSSGKQISYSIVTGVYVPSHYASDSALLEIRDPDLPTFGEDMERLPPQRLTECIRRVAAAQLLSLGGMPQSSLVLLEPSGEISLQQLRRAINSDAGPSPQTRVGARMRRLIEVEITPAGSDTLRLRFEANQDVDARFLLDWITREQRDQRLRPEIYAGDSGATMTLPYGLELRLST